MSTKKISGVILALSLIIIPIQQANAFVITIPVAIVAIGKIFAAKGAGVAAGTVTKKAIVHSVKKIKPNVAKKVIEQAPGTKAAARLSKKRTEHFVRDQLDDDKK